MNEEYEILHTKVMDRLQTACPLSIRKGTKITRDSTVIDDRESIQLQETIAIFPNDLLRCEFPNQVLFHRDIGDENSRVMYGVDVLDLDVLAPEVNDYPLPNRDIEGLDLLIYKLGELE